MWVKLRSFCKNLSRNFKSRKKTYRSIIRANPSAHLRRILSSWTLFSSYKPLSTSWWPLDERPSPEQIFPGFAPSSGFRARLTPTDSSCNPRIFIYVYTLTSHRVHFERETKKRPGARKGSGRRIDPHNSNRDSAPENRWIRVTAPRFLGAYGQLPETWSDPDCRRRVTRTLPKTCGEASREVPYGPLTSPGMRRDSALGCGNDFPTVLSWNPVVRGGYSSER